MRGRPSPQKKITVMNKDKSVFGFIVLDVRGFSLEYQARVIGKELDEQKADSNRNPEIFLSDLPRTDTSGRDVAELTAIVEKHLNTFCQNRRQSSEDWQPIGI